MRPVVKIVLAWLVGTTAAVGLGVAAVGVVSDSVTETRPERLSALGVRQALDGTEDGDPAGPPAPPPPAMAPAPSTAPTTAVPAEDRTYQLEGGTVGVRFGNGTARLLWATPRPGFAVDSGGSSTRVDVRFRSDAHESRLRAFWENGPQAETEERER